MYVDLGRIMDTKCDRTPPGTCICIQIHMSISEEPGDTPILYATALISGGDRAYDAPICQQYVIGDLDEIEDLFYPHMDNYKQAAEWARQLIKEAFNAPSIP